MAPAKQREQDGAAADAEVQESPETVMWLLLLLGRSTTVDFCFCRNIHTDSMSCLCPKQSEGLGRGLLFSATPFPPSPVPRDGPDSPES